jgi:hypothetical protein
VHVEADRPEVLAAAWQDGAAGARLRLTAGADLAAVAAALPRGAVCTVVPSVALAPPGAGRRERAAVLDALLAQVDRAVATLGTRATVRVLLADVRASEPLHAVRRLLPPGTPLGAALAPEGLAAADTIAAASDLLAVDLDHAGPRALARAGCAAWDAGIGLCAVTGAAPDRRLARSLAALGATELHVAPGDVARWLAPRRRLAPAAHFEPPTITHADDRN